MDRITNNCGINLAAAVWLAHDDYDYNSAPNSISVTTLIKPLRQIILPQRVPVEHSVPDISERIASRMGQALHTDVETSWVHHYKTSMAKLGYPQRVIDMVRINPVTQEPDTLPVYTEQRAERIVVIDGVEYLVSGKIDLIIEGRLQDIKKTSVWGYMNQKGVGTSWKLQGSLYRWLNQDKISHDELFIQYLLLDWARAMAKRDPNYPPHAVPVRVIKLMDVQETDKWVREKLRLLQQYADAPEADLPECSEEDLWRSDPVFKYYANPNATGRSTKNFDDFTTARAYMAEKGGKGRIDRVAGEVKACLYCPAFQACKQKDRYIADGSLFIEPK